MIKLYACADQHEEKDIKYKANFKYYVSPFCSNIMIRKYWYVDHKV